MFLHLIFIYWNDKYLTLQFNEKKKVLIYLQSFVAMQT